MSIQLSRLGPRAEFLFLSLPAHQRPRAQLASTCPHDQPLHHHIDMGQTNLTRRGDVYTHCKCEICAATNHGSPRPTCRILNDLSAEERQGLNRALARYDAATPEERKLLVEILRDEGEARQVQVYMFIEANEPPIHTTTSVPNIFEFRFRDLNIFELSNADSNVPSTYEFYLQQSGDFTRDSEVLGVRDISLSGNTLIYRRSGLSDVDCLGLVQLKMGIYDVYDGDILRNEPTAADNDSMFWTDLSTEGEDE
ncbi:hypothetical protein R3P38DRAFT_3238615 [Favolaschia claudopus]|uniref:Uncharacterized protein n=1 Tax=Favolaschia claudopus TaxID=2862362 RepID=A0AAV9ZA73_9AGAR